MLSSASYETLEVSQPSPFVTKVQLNRPQKSNAMNSAFWREIKQCLDGCSSDPECRVLMLTGAGKNFTSGLDLNEFAPKLMAATTQASEDVARRALTSMRTMIKPLQDSITAFEKCMKPVVAVIHGACVGGGVDLVSACDIRLATKDAYFQIKEVELGIIADVGTLQRLPKVVGGDSMLRELVYTGRKFSAEEALRMGMVSSLYEDRESAESAGLGLAKVIASKSPVAVQGSKVNLNYSRDHTVDESLEYAMVWNGAMLQSEDLMKAVQALMNKEQPVFAKL